ncbi:unnamed protein product [Rotaria socialis]|nr:unnamed protein product [Rotaria socialis]
MENVNQFIIHLLYLYHVKKGSSECDTYITEKYWIQGLTGHAVPIDLGATKEHYKRIAVPNSYIHVDDFQTVEDLAKELHRLNRNDSGYSKYISNQYSPLSFMNMHSTLCLLDHYRYLHFMKENNQEINYPLRTIRKIFRITNMHLPNSNRTAAKKNLIRI